ncbi:MAG: methionyl-tRNA formyltransferase [Vampirovibrionales bacterium]|nr:methionyl-tRNA formyltransferase [Vampirovibrionales bacterium]
MTTPLRVVFMGTPQFSVPCLQSLIADAHFEVVAVLTQPDRPSGRGQKLSPSPVAVVAEAAGIPVYKPQRLRMDTALKATLAQLNPDTFVTIAFGQILDAEVLAIPKLGTVNVHASLLPQYRGANPIQWAILNGDAETGLTTMLTELGVDTGPMLLTHTQAITPTDTTATLTEKLSEAAGPLLISTLQQLSAGTLTPTPQQDTHATHAPKLSKADGTVDFNAPANVVERRIRALQPWPGTTVMHQGNRLKLIASTVIPNHDHSSPSGTVLSASTAGMLLACGNNTVLEITQVHPENRRPMDTLTWYRSLPTQDAPHIVTSLVL